MSVDPAELRELEALRAGDEEAFMVLVRVHSALLRVAQIYVRRAVAEEVVQETWLGGSEGARPLRGPLVAQDLDLPDPRQHGQDAGRARGPTMPFSSLGTRAACPSRRSTPTASAPEDRVAGPLGVDAAPLTSCPRNGCCGGDARRDPTGDRGAPRRPSAR